MRSLDVEMAKIVAWLKKHGLVAFVKRDGKVVLVDKKTEKVVRVA